MAYVMRLCATWLFFVVQLGGPGSDNSNPSPYGFGFVNPSTIAGQIWADF